MNMEKIEHLIIENNLLRRTLMEPTTDPFFEGGRHFRFKPPLRKLIQIIEILNQDRPQKKSLEKRLEDFSEG